MENSVKSKIEEIFSKKLEFKERKLSKEFKNIFEEINKSTKLKTSDSFQKSELLKKTFEEEFTNSNQNYLVFLI